tara:strand:+ start:281 stop:421 length:141 start_codon:yes stop_codon:yes gene_type:complete
MLNLLIIILAVLLFFNMRIGIRIWENIEVIKKDIKNILKNILDGKR